MGFLSHQNALDIRIHKHIVLRSNMVYLLVHLCQLCLQVETHQLLKLFVSGSVRSRHTADCRLDVDNFVSSGCLILEYLIRLHVIDHRRIILSEH